MKRLLKIAAFTIVATFVFQTLVNFGVVEFNKDKIDYEALQKILNENESTGSDKAFNETPDIPGADYGDIHIEKGDEYFEKGMKSLAVNEYVESIKENDNNPAAFTKIGKVHFDNPAETAKARENFVKAIQLDPNYMEARIYLGRSYIKENNFDKAREIFANITAKNQTAKYYKGLLASFYGEHETAKNLFAEAIAINTNEEISNKSRTTLKAYEEFARNQGGQDMHLKILLSRAYNQVEEYQMAMPILFEVLKEQKDYRDAWIILGYAYLQTDKIHDAIYAFETAKTLDPQKPETLYFLGLAHFAQNDLAQAIPLIEQALQNGFEPSIQANQKLAEIYLLNKQFDKAAEKYEKIIEVNDSDVNSYIRPVWLYIDKLKNPQRAIALAQRAVEAHGTSAMSHNLLGWAYAANNQFEEGKTSLQKALEINPDLDAAYLNLGWIYEKKGSYNLAISNYQKANELGGQSAAANLAHERYNKLIEAKQDLTETFKADIVSPNEQENQADIMPPKETTYPKEPQESEETSKVGKKFTFPKIIKK